MTLWHTHAHTCPPTHSLTHPLTHSLIHTHTHPPTNPLTHSHTHLPTHSPTYPLTHSLTHPSTHVLTRLLIHPPTHSDQHNININVNYATDLLSGSSACSGVRKCHNAGTYMSVIRRLMFCASSVLFTLTMHLLHQHVTNFLHPERLTGSSKAVLTLTVCVIMHVKDL